MKSEHIPKYFASLDVPMVKNDIRDPTSILNLYE